MRSSTGRALDADDGSTLDGSLDVARATAKRRSIQTNECRRWVGSERSGLGIAELAVHAEHWPDV